MTVYLRPEPKPYPVEVIDSIEKSGIIVDHKHAIALYTSRSTPNRGDQGPPGEDMNSWFDTIIASASDEFTPIPISLTQAKTTYRAPYPLDLTMGYIRASLTQEPENGNLVVDVHMNGVSMFTPGKLLQIDEGMRTSVGSVAPAELAVTYVPDDAEFLVYVIETGLDATGTGLKVALTGIKTT